MKTRSTGVYVRNRKIASHVVDNNLYLLDENSDEVVILNETGRFFWNLLAKPVSATDLCLNLQETYKVDSETAQKDTEKFLKSLLKRNFLRFKS